MCLMNPGMLHIVCRTERREVAQKAGGCAPCGTDVELYQLGCEPASSIVGGQSRRPRQIVLGCRDNHYIL